jgi:hypothetical protein
MHTEPGSTDTGTPLFVEGSAPRQSAQIRSHFELRKGLEWDASAYLVGRLTHQDSTFQETIPGYIRFDTGLTWKIRDDISVSVVGQNLQRDHHLEFNDFFGSLQSGQIKRSAYAKLTWKF